MLSFSPAISAPDASAPAAPWIRISYGQSHRTNFFPSFGSLGVNAMAALAFRVDNRGVSAPGPGPMSNGQGVLLVGTPNGVTNYADTDVISIGRCAVAAQQLLRVRDGANALTPYIEFCTACPGSSWTSGSGGGLGPGLTFTGAIVNDVLTVSSIVAAPGGGAVTANQSLVGAGVDGRTIILQDIDGHQQAGTYAVAAVQFVGESQFTTANATFMGSINAGNASAGNLLFIDQMLSGTVTIGDTLSAPAAAGTVITAFVSALTQVEQDDTTGDVRVAPRAGSPGGTGTYRVSIGAPQNVAARTMSVHGSSWYNQAILLPQFQKYPVLPSGKYLAGLFKSVGYTQFGSSRYGVPADAGGIADLADMLTLYDAMNLPGAGTSGMFYYIQQQAQISNLTTFDLGCQAKYLFCRSNAPGQGGTWSGRCFAVVPFYAWPMDGISNTHLPAYGTIRVGEWEGYVAHQVEDRGNTAWTPLWRPLTGGAIVRNGQSLRVPFTRPNSPDFATAPMVFQSNPQDGIKVWPQYGFHVKRGGADLTVTPLIAGMEVWLGITETLNAGDVLEVSYSYYGPGGPNPGVMSGVGGNLTMNGPPSVFYPDRTIDAWAWPFLETITI